MLCVYSWWYFHFLTGFNGVCIFNCENLRLHVFTVTFSFQHLQLEGLWLTSLFIGTKQLANFNIFGKQTISRYYTHLIVEFLNHFVFNQFYFLLCFVYQKQNKFKLKRNLISNGKNLNPDRIKTVVKAHST